MTVPSPSMAMDTAEWLTEMEAVLEALNEGVGITNENHRILFANSRFVEMTGIPKNTACDSSKLHLFSDFSRTFAANQMHTWTGPMSGPVFSSRPAGVNTVFARRDTTTELIISGTRVLAVLVILFCLVPLAWACLKYWLFAP